MVLAATAFPDEDGVSIHIHYGHFAPQREGVHGRRRDGQEGRVGGEMEDVIPH